MSYKFFNVNSDIQDAIQCLWFRKVRSILSAAGIAIGTTALVAMLSISEGAKQQAQKNILSLGIDTIRLESKVSSDSFSIANNQNLSKGIVPVDIETLKENFPDSTIGYFKFFSSQRLLIRGQPVQGDVLLVNKSWFISENIDLLQGRLIAESDLLNHSQVCLLGASIGNDSSLNETTVGWNGNSCRLIGTLSEKGKMLIEGSVLSTIDVNNSVLMPIEQFISIIDYFTGVTIKVATEKPEEIKAISGDIVNLISQTHLVDDYSVLLPITLFEKAQQEQQMFNLIMGSISGLSLLVGGIGIMNVMLAHLAEQTREIGLRLSIGATKMRIAQLFLSYSLILAVLGTFIGVLSGILLALLIQHYANWPISFSVFSLTIGPVFSILAGTIFGLYPALKAAQIQPNIALRQV